MKWRSWLRRLDSFSDNQKSKIKKRPCGLKLVGFFAVLVILLWGGALVEAQQTGKAARIGYLDQSTAAGSSELLDEFRKRMTQFNWIEGKNLAIEYRYADRKNDRLAGLAVELVALKVDLILVATVGATLAAKQATTSIPIVMLGNVDPVAAGLVASLARPGGNITGLAAFSVELAGKRLEILKEMLLNST